jgi:hypothetical protein
MRGRRKENMNSVILEYIKAFPNSWEEDFKNKDILV